MKKAIELIGRIKEIAQDGETVGTCEVLKEILTKKGTIHENTASRLKSLSKDYDRATERHEERAKELYELRGLLANQKGDLTKIVKSTHELIEENDALTAKIERLTDFCDYLTDKLTDGATRSAAVEKLNKIING